MNKYLWMTFLLLASLSLCNSYAQSDIMGELSPENLALISQENLPQNETCTTYGGDYGNLNLIPDECYKTFLLTAPAKQWDSANDDQLFAIGSDNVLYIKNMKEMPFFIDGKEFIYKERFYTISGVKSKLHHIIAVSIRPNFHEVAVINEDSKGVREILVFPTYRSGNIKPYKIIDGVFLDGSTSLSYHPSKEEIVVLNQIKHSILFISSEANSRSVKISAVPRVLREIAGDNTGMVAPIDFSIKDNEIFVLEKNEKIIHNFKLTDVGDRFPASIIPTDDIPIDEPSSLNVNQNGSFEMENLSGAKESFSLD